MFTHDKASFIMISASPKLSQLVYDCKLGGAGAGNMNDETADEYGHFDLDNTWMATMGVI